MTNKASSDLTRRRFFAETAGLVFTLTLAPVPRLIAKTDGTNFLPNAWITIAPDNVAGIAEIALDRNTGIIKVINFWVVMDSGFSVQPRHLIAELEGSIIFGLGHALREEITIKGGHVQQSNFTDYEPLRMDETPGIKAEMISSDNPPLGGGEGAVQVVAASVGNAVLALTGVRLRDLPMSPARVKAALQGRS